MRAIIIRTHLVFCCLLASAFPLLAADLSDLTWDATGATVIITDCDTAAVGVLVIPDLIEGKSVTAIGDEAFRSCAGLTSITIPPSVTSIGDEAFRFCTSLASINIPASITSIGDYTFRSCTSLASIDLPEGLTSIGNYAFRSCTSLASITIPENVTSMGHWVLYDCTSLAHITFAGNAPSLGATVFGNVDAAAQVYVFSAATGFGATFGGLPVVVLPSELSYVINGDDTVTITDCDTAATGSLAIPAIIEGRPVTTIGDQAFQHCTSLTGITLPDGVTSIGDGVFWNCTSLTGIIIPDSLTSIGDEVFRLCTSLVSIDVSVDNPNYTSADGVLFNKNQTTILQYPEGKSGAAYSIPASVTSIGDWAFNQCPSLASIDLPAGLTSIGNYAFRSCTSLAGITLPDSVTSIGGAAFSGCTSLTSITIPDSVTTIGDGVFRFCTSLVSIDVSVDNPNYTSADGVLFNKNQTTILHYPAGKSGAAYSLPASVTSIEDSAFRGCTALTSIVLPDSVTSIGFGAFYGCTALTSIVLPDSVTSIGRYAFSGCTSLVDVTVPAGMVNNGMYTLMASALEATVVSNATEIAALEAQVAALQAEVALLEQRPTLEEVQDARLGSVVLIKDEASGEINFDFNLEETEDLANWTPVVSGTWTDPGDGGIELDLPLAPDKRFYRVVVEFE